MRRLAITVASVLVLALVQGPPSASAKHGFKDCGDQKRPGAGWSELEAYNVGCEKARDFAKRFTFHGFKEGPWNCDDKPAGYEQTQFSCTRAKEGVGHQHVRFIIGS